MNAFVNITVGTLVESGGKRYVITNILSLESILAKDQETGKSRELKIADITSPLNPESKPDEKTPIELSVIDPNKMREAEQWIDRLAPLLAANRLTIEMVERVALEAGVHRATVYRKLYLYEASGRTSSLIPNKPDGGKNASRLPPETEEIVQSTIRDFYLHKQKCSVEDTIKEVERRFRNAQLTPPHPNTIRKRIRALSAKEKDKARLGTRVATAIHSALPGHFPGADFPLAVVQIDHTPLDITIVDDEERLSAGRPWLTLAIDVFSRTVAGFHLSLDKPNTMSVGLCIAHAIMPKEKYLAKFGITTEWNVWGVMKQIHADNAREFRGNMLRRACKEYNIDLEWRPVKQPHYGGHIERLLGTFLKEIHTLPGTTYSNPKERGEYDTDKEAVLTFSEFEKWLVTHITGTYHQDIHSTLLTSPLKQYERGILGNDELPGRGLPLRVKDEDRLLLDLMPYFERTIQEYGVEIDIIHYFSDVLRRYVHAKDPDNPKRKRKFIFKRRPNDISVIYFYDPELNEYFEVPYRDRSRSPMSVWELRASQQRLVEQGVKEINERLIFESHEEKRRQVEEAKRKTKAMRLQEQRRANNKLDVKPKMINDKVRSPSSDFVVAPVVPRVVPPGDVED